MLTEYKVHILAISETHLNPAKNSDLLKIDGYNMCRPDRDSRGVGVAFYCQDHKPGMI